MTFYGIFLAHVFSVLAAAILALNLACRFYNFRKILESPIDWDVTRDILSFALLMMPGNVIKRLVSDLPVLLLKGMLPGDAGAHPSTPRCFSSVSPSIDTGGGRVSRTHLRILRNAA